MVISKNKVSIYFVVDDLYYSLRLNNDGIRNYVDVLNGVKSLYKVFPEHIIENIKVNTIMDAYLHSVLFKNNKTVKYYGLDEEDSKELLDSVAIVGSEYFNNVSMDDIKGSEILYSFIQLDNNKVFIVYNDAFGKKIKIDKTYKHQFYNDLLDYLVYINRFNDSNYFTDIFNGVYNQPKICQF
jgi:hypothetical protein